jgi:hypothetical protein
LLLIGGRSHIDSFETNPNEQKELVNPFRD